MISRCVIQVPGHIIICPDFPSPDRPASPDTSRTIRLLSETSNTRPSGPSGLTKNFPDPPATTRFPAKAHSGDCARPFYKGENVLRRDNDFLYRGSILTSKLLKQGYSFEKLKTAFRSLALWSWLIVIVIIRLLMTWILYVLSTHKLLIILHTI